jgi:hypothetical protein
MFALKRSRRLQCPEGLGFNHLYVMSARNHRIEDYTQIFT